MRRLNSRAQGMKTLLPQCSKIKSTTHAKAMIRVDLPNKQSLAIGPLCEAVAAQQQNCRSNSSALHTGYIASMPPQYPFRIYFWLIRDPITGKLAKTRWRMSDQDASRYPGAVRVELDYLEITGPFTESFNPHRQKK